ncbi:hypothetical protein [Zavarzinella formosa]|uniref:hypothetical protein n=1 Tax=Zavarzinella formosa TaxID=360055 RepID=UPI0002DC4917|nr:hypothetical protein [Zavarzinella formosa]
MRTISAKTFGFGVLIGLGLMALTGCSGGGRTVKGQLQTGGQPYRVAEREQASILLVKEGNSTTEGITGKIEPDGSFHFPKPVPDGPYKVLVTHTGDYTEFLKQKPGARKATGPPDKLKGAFTEQKSPLRIDITRSTSLVVDLQAKTITKK